MKNMCRSRIDMIHVSLGSGKNLLQPKDVYRYFVTLSELDRLLELILAVADSVSNDDNHKVVTAA